MTNKKIACPSSENVCRTIKVSYVNFSGANITPKNSEKVANYMMTGVIYIYD